MHIPVLLQEVIEFLKVTPNKNYLDCTLGGAGYTQAILEKNGPRGKVVACELDLDAIKHAKQKLKPFGKRLIIINDNFRNISQITNYKLQITGIVYDLGLSSDLILSSKRGFSFLGNEPLDMRMDVRDEMTAADIVNTKSEQEIADIIFQYGEERFARRIARRIKQEREKKVFTTTSELVECIKYAVPRQYRYGRIHFATRTFQALRIAVNHELENLSKSLEEAYAFLEPGGRLVVVSFHSLEDRIVKRFFKKLSQEKKVLILTKKPVTATTEECDRNPQSRSAKLRAIEKIS